MTITELKDYIANLTSHVTFMYCGYSCGIDPLSKTEYTVWCGSNTTTVDSIEKVMTERLFNGKSLEDIWDEVIGLDF